MRKFIRKKIFGRKANYEKICEEKQNSVVFR